MRASRMRKLAVFLIFMSFSAMSFADQGGSNLFGLGLSVVDSDVSYRSPHTQGLVPVLFIPFQPINHLRIEPFFGLATSGKQMADDILVFFPATLYEEVAIYGMRIQYFTHHQWLSIAYGVQYCKRQYKQSYQRFGSSDLDPLGETTTKSVTPYFGLEKELLEKLSLSIEAGYRLSQVLAHVERRTDHEYQQTGLHTMLSIRFFIF